MRIAFISNFYYPFIGGAEEVCRMEAEALANKGYDVSVITTSTSSTSNLSGSEKIKGVKVFRLDLPNIRLKRHPSTGFSWLIFGSMNYLLGAYNPFAGQAIKRIIEKIKPDIIHVHNFMGKFSLSIFHALHELRIPIIVTLHDYSLICPRATLFCHAKIPCAIPKIICDVIVKMQEILLRGKIVFFISPSKFLADRFKEKFRDVEVAVIPNPIQEIEINTEKSFDQFQILWIGRLVWYKGVRILLKAFRNLKNETFRLIIAGSGPDFEIVKSFSSVDSRIVPLGFVSEEEKKKLLKRANFTVIPSLWCEPFPMVALESFASGTPVIASKIGGLQEIIKNGYNGKLFEPGNSEELRDIIAELAENERQFRKLQNGAIKSARNYCINRHIEMLENIYAKLT